MENTGPLELLRRIDNHRKGMPDALDPSGLQVAERLPIVDHLRFEGWTTEGIAHALKVSTRTIEKDYHRIRKARADLGDFVPAKEMFGELVAVAARVRAKALKEGDLRLVWTVTVDLLREGQSLGLVPKAPTSIEVTPLSPEEAKQRYQERRALLDELDRIIDAEVSENGSAEHGGNGRIDPAMGSGNGSPGSADPRPGSGE